MKQWFDKPIDAKPWVFDEDLGTHAAGFRSHRIGDTLSITALAFLVVFVIGMAVTNRHDLPRYYPSCGWAKFVGVAPIARAEKGYRKALDTDNDGFACEPYQDR